MARILLSFALAASLCAPAAANCLPTSQVALGIIQAADAFSISQETAKGHRYYDQMAPWCAKGWTGEVACQGLAVSMIRHYEKPTPLTCIGNYVVTVAYAFYIRKALVANVLHFKL